ncbi:MAG: type I secretion system permease/ATPase, partial [Notoacmeibacter sp.]
GLPDQEDIARIVLPLGLETQNYQIPARGPQTNDFPLLLVFESGTVCFAGDEAAFAILEKPSLKNGKLNSAWSFGLHYSNDAERAATGSGKVIEKPHWLFGSFRTFWQNYSIVIVAALVINLIALAIPIFTMNVYDRILPNNATSSLIALSAGVGLALVFDYLLKNARSLIIDTTGRNIDLRISHLLFEKVLHTRLSDRPQSTGEYANRVSQIEFVREFFTSATLSTLIDTVFVVIFLGVVYFIAGWIVVVPAVAFVLAVIVGLVAQYRIGKRVARAANEAAERQSLLVETISTVETVKSLRAEPFFLKKWNELTRSSSRTSEEIKHISASAGNLTGLIQQLVTVFVVIAGAFEFSNGRITMGAIIAASMLAGRAVSPLMQIAMTLARMKQAMLSLRILNKIMQQQEDRPSSVGFVNRSVKDGSFAFEDVSFSYPGSDAKVLRNLALSIKSGERVGIIGKIGSGKTTLGRLLTGLYEAQEGKVLINGVDVRQYHPAEVRGAVAYSGQSTDLFSGTLKENLQLGRADATDEEIIEAARKTGVDEFAGAHPRGYDLAVGERGNNLSGGQKQAVAITRLLLAKPRIVFLDEPSGSLDLATERQLIGNLARAFGRDVTLVISTHRYSLLELIDRLVVIDRGRIVADGPKDKVLEALAARNAAQKTAGTAAVPNG